MALLLGIGLLKRKMLFFEVLATGGIAYMLVQVSKLLVDRPRPAVLLSDVQSRELFVSGLGYPSGHTALATAMSLTLLPYLPRRWRWLPLAWIPLVGLSRIYLGVHAPLDVLGGFAIGLFVVALQQLVVRAKRLKLKNL